MLCRRTAIGTLCAMLVAVVSACTIRDDSTQANQLDRLRVLAIASEPADLISGETAELSALVYEPEGAAVTYAWSWCLSRGGSDEAFACNIAEDELQAAWDGLDTGTSLPPYDLGSEATASFALAFELNQAIDLCAALTRDEENQEVALFLCLSNLGLSIQLTVTSATDQVVSLRNIAVLSEGDQRNLNPVLGAEIAVSLRSSGALLEPGAPLRTEAIYDLVAPVDLLQSEVFLPDAQEGLPPPEARNESLFLSWFVTTGATHRKGEQRTSYFDGGDIDSLIENIWEMPFDLEADQARIFLVLRDERGGTSWGEYSFELLEAE